MTKRRFCFTFFLLICFSLPLTATAQTVNIPDDNLRAIIAGALGKASGETITVADMERFVIYDFPNANIRDLTGLEYATNFEVLDLGVEPGTRNNSNSIQDISPLEGLNKLTHLWLERNEISDISPLAGLNNLEILQLWDNLISDISPLAGLSNLEELFLASNLISNISHLAGLNSLVWLQLNDNSISDISPIAGLTNLRGLFLWDNSISDISPLEGLTNLGSLNLSENSITDISPIVANTGLGNGDIVWLEGNPLNSASINTHIPALQRRGVDVRFDAVVTEVVTEEVNIPDDNLRTAIEHRLGKASGATITTVDMATLTRLVALNDNISDLTGLEHATNLTQLGLGPEQVQQGVWRNNNSISDISALQGLTKLTVSRS